MACGASRACTRPRPASAGGIQPGARCATPSGGINPRASRGLCMPAVCRGDAGGRRREGHGSATGPALGGAAGGGAAAVCASQQQAHAPIPAGAQVRETGQEPPCSRPPARPPPCFGGPRSLPTPWPVLGYGCTMLHHSSFALGNCPEWDPAPLPLALSIRLISQSSKGGVRNL